nr:MAG TPA: hypothetical protein [Crassvirales sp.]
MLSVGFLSHFLTITSKSRIDFYPLISVGASNTRGEIIF